MRADPKTSEGARMERKAVVAAVRRALRDSPTNLINGRKLLDWMLRRRKRYDKAAGGLGRK